MALTPTLPSEASDVAHSIVLLPARLLRAARILGASLSILAAPAYAADMPSQPVPPSSIAQPAANSPQAAARPLWSELSPAQQQALAPLAGEWDKLDTLRKNKWLAIGNRYAKMKPAEQQRMQERMRDWVTLTPEQRRIARESYARAKRLGPEQKSAQWEQYQQLPEEQKKRLAADAASKKRVATLPSNAAQANHSKTVPPIKSAPKPVIERSVTPQAASESVLQAPSPAQEK